MKEICHNCGKANDADVTVGSYECASCGQEHVMDELLDFYPIHTANTKTTSPEMISFQKWRCNMSMEFLRDCMNKVHDTNLLHTTCGYKLRESIDACIN